jgi:hypothetical protein
MNKLLLIFLIIASFAVLVSLACVLLQPRMDRWG